MKKTVCGWLACLFAVLLLALEPPVYAVAVEDVSVSAECAVLMEAETGRVLYAKNADQPAAMASTTKIMTAWLTLEVAAVQDDVVTITEEMVAVEGSSLGLQAGWKISLSNLAAGMLTVSGNDAARAAAIFLTGSEEAFACRMNERAAELGMTNTHFATASGLDAQDHYSTAADMAKLAAAALENEAFFAIVSQTSYPVCFDEPEKTVVLSNHNKLLSTLAGCVGLKTGYTKKAGRCLVSAVERDGVRLICVTLNAPDDWNDHTCLYETAFASLQMVACEADALPAALPVVGGVQDTVPVTWDKLPSAVVFREDEVVSVRVKAASFLYAPVACGSIIGQVELYIDGELTDTAVLRAGETVAAQQPEKTWWQKFLLLFRIGE